MRRGARPRPGTVTRAFPRPGKSSTLFTLILDNCSSIFFALIHQTVLSLPNFYSNVFRFSTSSLPPANFKPTPSFPQPSKMSSSVRPATIAAISVGAVAAGVLAYALYFDHKRRNDPEFRKQLKRESKKQARAAKEEAEAQGKEQKKSIRAAVEKANQEGFPTDPESIEMYFMQEVASGEALCAKGTAWVLRVELRP